MTAPVETTLSFRALDPPADAGLVHSWVTRPGAAPCWLRPDAPLVRLFEDPAARGTIRSDPRRTGRRT